MLKVMIPFQSKDPIFTKQMLSTGKHVHTKSYILVNSNITRKSDGTNIVLLTLIWVGGVILPCWFSLNNSETVKATTMTFCSI